VETEHSDAVTSVKFSPDGKWIVSGSEDMLVKIWDVETGAEVSRFVRTLTGHSDKIQTVAISPDGKWVGSGSTDSLVKIWNAETGPELCTLTGHSGWVWSTSFSPDGKRIVTGSEDKLVKIWNVETGAEVSILEELHAGWPGDGVMFAGVGCSIGVARVFVFVFI
ncbi:WD40-repeat-containing domain protein, partial [Baffinella frigidus]